jgi:nucleoside-diphosphate-sugar epimerase
VLPLDGKRVLLTGASGFIGTSLVDLLHAARAQVVNADINPPLAPAHRTVWRETDVVERLPVESLVAELDPHFVVHLAARTDTDSSVVDDYAVNHVGTRTVVDALTRAPALQRFVFVSTQFVLGPDAPFTSEQQLAPHTAYGDSKARAERELRACPPEVPWVIARPTNVWGPWHLRYQREFWRVLRRGLYVHPAAPDPIRSYGYVGSVCLQLAHLLVAEESRVAGRALYVGDVPVRLSEWVDAFSIALRGRPARRVPAVALRGLAKVGDVAQRTGLPAPINSSRLRSMTQDYPTPMQRTTLALGRLPAVSLDTGVAETVAWLDAGAAPDVRGWLADAPLSGTPKEEGTRGQG